MCIRDRYAAAKSSAEYHAKQNGEHGVWQYKVDLALPCATPVSYTHLDVYKRQVIGAETLSKIMDWNDRSTCVLFGDGAGAAVVEVDSEFTKCLSFTLIILV